METFPWLPLLPHLIAVAISVFVALYCWRHQNVRGASEYAVVAGIRTLVILMKVLLLVSLTLEAKIIWHNLWIALSFASNIANVAFAVRFTNTKIPRPNLIFGALYLLPLMLGIALFIPALYPLIVPAVQLIPMEEGLNDLTFSPSNITQAVTISLFVMLFITIGLLLLYLFRSQRAFRIQIGVVAASFIVQIIGGVLYGLNVRVPIFSNASVAGLVVGTVMVLWALFRHRLFDLMPVAREALIESMTDYVVVIDRDDRIVDLNSAVARAAGKSASALIGLSVKKVFPEQTALFEQFRGITDTSQEIKVKIAGRPQWFQLKITSLRDYHGDLSGRLIVAHDITPIKEAQTRLSRQRRRLQHVVDGKTAALREKIRDQEATEQALRRSEERLRAVIENQSEFIVRWKPDGTRLYVNDAYCRFVQQSEDEIIGTNFLSRLQDNDRQAILDKVARLSPDHPEETSVHQAPNPDGSWSWQEWAERGIFDANGELVEIQSVGRDVHDRKVAEDALRVSEERFRLILENMPILFDAFDEWGNIIVWNKACEEATGYSADEVIGNPKIMELLYPDPDYRAKVWAASNDPDATDFTFDLTCKSGELRTVSWFETYRTLTVPGWAMWGMGIDATERRRAEDALKQRDRVLSAVSRACTHLLVAPNWETQIEDVLKLMGEAADIDRASLFLYDTDQDGIFRGTIAYEWDRPGTPRLKGTSRFTNIDMYGVGFGPAMDMLKQKKAVDMYPGWMPESAREPFTSVSKTYSSVHVPVFSDNKLLGSIALAITSLTGKYTHLEIDAFQIAADMLGAVMARKRSEAELRENEARLRLATKLGGLGIWDWNMKTDRTRWYGEMFRIYGVSESEFTGHGADYIDFTREDYRATQSQNFEDSFKVAITPEQLAKQQIPAISPKELCIVRPDGSEAFTLGDAITLLDSSGQPASMIGITVDITQRKLTEAALLQSERRYHSVVTSLAEGVLLYDASGKIIDCNPATESILRVKREDLIAGSLRDAGFTLRNEDGSEVDDDNAPVMRTLKTGEPLRNLLLHAEAPNNMSLWLSLNTERLLEVEGDSHNVLVSLTDVTGQVLRERAITRYADQLALLSQISRQIAAELDITDVLDQAVHLIHDLFHYDCVELSLPHPQSHELELRANAGTKLDTSALREHGRTVSEISIPILMSGATPDGILHIQSLQPDSFGVNDTVVLQALVDQLAIALENARLFEAERRERALAQTYRRATQAMSNLGDARAALKVVSDLLAEILPYDRLMILLEQNGLLRAVVAVGLDDDEKEMLDPYSYSDIPVLHQSMSEGTPLHVSANGERPKDCEDLPGYTTSTTGWIGVPLVASGVVIGYLSAATDQPHGYVVYDVETVQAFAHEAVLAISQSRLLDELQTMQGHLTRVARLSVAGEIAAGVAHQINNPLTSVIGHTHLLMSEFSPDSSVYERAEKIKQGAYRAASVVQRMLDFARVRPFEVEEISINASLETAIGLIRSHIEPRLARLNLEFEPDLPPIQGSQVYLEDVWINLLLNAADVLRDRTGGQINIKTSKSATGDSVIVSIEDNGPGMSKETLTHIFDPFFTTKSHGTGLGLAICHDVVTQHGGTIRVESEEGRGALFTITLPVVTSKDAMPE